ncbi:MAG: hypothetical protein ACI88A_000887 [Paraglaciecola sp.]|jgi:uncharacterized protein (DUF58 family)
MKRLGIRPSRKQLWHIGVLCFLGMLLPLLAMVMELQSLGLLVFPLVLIMLAVLLIDLFVSRHSPNIAVKREAPTNLSVNAVQNIMLALANRGESSIFVEVAEHIPSDWELLSELPGCMLDAQKTLELEYSVRPLKRGSAEITGSELRVDSRFGYWQINWFIDNVSDYKIYPNFTAISDLSGLNGSINLAQAGLKKYNMRGSGMDFLQLRDYRQGESMRQIDWRATSRFNRLISKEFQEEKNQHVIIMLDAGRRMRVQDDELSYFDHALNGLIMLSYTALKNGDNLSVQSFGSESRWLGQIKGAKNVSQVLNHFYDLYPQKIASDYLSAAQELLQKQPKRALVLLVSCLRDEDFSDLVTAVKLLQAKHLVAVISIAEPIYQQISDTPVEHFEQALTYASAQKLQLSIERNMQRLKQQGVICLHTPAQQLTPSVINTYLSVKNAGLL